MTHRTIRAGLLIALWGLFQWASIATAANKSSQPVTKYVRFRVAKTVAYGILEGDRVRRLSGDLFGDFRKTDTTYSLSEVQLLVPSRPTQVFAMAGNYKSHLKDADVPPKFQIPQPFYKSRSCLQRDGGPIVIPKGATEVHFEAELVVVIGKRAKNVPKEKALDYVFGVTCGNDVSARVWQKNDVQWWRAKGSDTFGPCGPVIATGLDYDNLGFELRLNGEVKQKDNTKNMIHNVASTVSFISQHVTLHPGDLIFTGTTGETSALKPGDIVEVEIEGIGVLRNTVRAEK